MQEGAKEHVVVIGFGWVGQANALALRKMGYRVSYFDPKEPDLHYPEHSLHGIERLTAPLGKDAATTCYLVCVGDKVAEDGTQDISAIRAALDSLKGAKGTVILRSTVIPDMLEDLAFDFYVPEFLHEKKAVEECLWPYYFVVGAHAERAEPSFFRIWKARTALCFKGTPREAALVKYLSNTWNALRIAFVNEFGDIIRKPRGKEDIDAIEHVINFVLRGDPYLRYGRAFGGHCLPKDMRAFAAFYGGKGESVALLRGAYAANEKHREVSERHPLVPEWFSAWPLPHISGVVALKELVYSLKKNILHPREFFERRILRSRV